MSFEIIFTINPRISANAITNAVALDEGMNGSMQEITVISMS